MSEDDIQADAAPVASGEPGAAAPSSFGGRLAAAREGAGLSVGDMAARLRLHVNQVRALEAEDLAHLPETAYVRGFVRGYARSLGLDPAPLIDDLNSKVAPPANSVVEGMTRAPDYSPVRAAAHEQASRWLVLGLAVVALIALGAIGWYATRTSAPEPAAAPTSAAPPTSPAPAATPAALSQAATTPTIDPTPPGADAGSSATTGTEPAPAPSHPLTEVTGPLTMHFSGTSWVEVTDASGKVLVSQIARAGEVLQPVGTLPLAVVIGDASKATISVRGEAFSLEASTRSNIARFTVK